jgi:hypothetical protein
MKGADKMNEKIEKLAKIIENQQIQVLKERNSYCEANLSNKKVKIVSGRKYTKIDVGNSGFIMIENSSGNIFGIKAYGVVHKGHSYGNLDTINNYFWGNFYPIKNNKNQCRKVLTKSLKSSILVIDSKKISKQKQNKQS